MSTAVASPAPLNDPSASAGAKPVLIVVMGTSGSGKSTLGSQLASALAIPFIDGDDLHPASNVEKMSRGIPLTDDDREPWLRKIRRTAIELTRPASQHLARGLTRGQHRDEILKRFLEVDEDDVDHVRKLAEVYETSAVQEAQDAEAGKLGASQGAPTKFLDPRHHPSTRSSSGGGVRRRGCVIACSALKRSYRQLLRGNIADLASYDAADPHRAELGAPPDLDVYHVYMDLSADILWGRMQARKNHFMKFEMLKSQLDTLEVPVEDVEYAAAAAAAPTRAPAGGDKGNGKAGAAKGEPGVIVVPVEADTATEEVTRRAKQRIDNVVGRLA
ncbi:uncharacterized protein PFL1_00848 [Pseudozyma flocculosa PF-1]|uniref:gluconokinase n=1 Tax=Pseudozyma flocculosa TaxID=84751 RepID=A0A5C3F4S8_9BASI|nr:uncharacterized protein PFL1_00848 [Pseudozyma flocculosa PF-1]EPQ31515.1 hypothetical protein PFL1_00848 [Pseudozyma flocculosa PF-1]SPO38697.1 related to thermoresistant gluconokinase [Pseudozyma flocculosa]